MNLILFGAPGSGKGTQAQRICAAKALKHVSTGDLLRDAVSHGTDLGKKVEGIMAAGELVSDEIVLELLREAVANARDSEGLDGWLLDGYPRNVEQAKALDGLLTGTAERIDALVVLDVDSDAIVDRLSKRRSCGVCRSVFHLVVNPPTTPGKCDKCGGDLVHRKDDQPETIANRLDVYKKQTLPILVHYEGKVAIHRIDGNQTVGAVSGAIEAALK